MAKSTDLASREALQIQQGSLYSLTRAGRAQLKKELASWNRLSGAIDLVVEEA